ncbi:hypothetical protein K469DRAFT_782921, partial [Zopfia rhizophila CBS 207.26]
VNSPRQPNFDDIEELKNRHRSTQYRRKERISRPRAQFRSESSKLLTNAQEEEILTWIDIMTLRGLPPTPVMLQNFVEMIVEHEIGSKWVSRFCNRYKDRIDRCTFEQLMIPVVWRITLIILLISIAAFRKG